MRMAPRARALLTNLRDIWTIWCDMTDRKKTRAEQQAEVALLVNLAEQEQWLKEMQLRQALIPREWYEMDRLAPVEPKRTKVTLRLDDKTLRWF